MSGDIARTAAVPPSTGTPAGVDEKSFYAYFEHAPIAILSADAEGRMVYANPAALELLGYTLEEIQGKQLMEMHAPGDRAKLAAELPQILAKGSLRRTVEMLGKDGREIAAELHGVVLPNGHLLGFFEDITEKEQGRRELEESEGRFQQFFEQITDAVAIHGIDEQGNPKPFLEVNEAACAMLGCTREELLKRSPLSFGLDPSNVDWGDWGRRLFAGETLSFEHELTRVDGRRVPVEVRTTLFRYRGQPAVMTVTRDISARKEAERKEAESERRLGIALEAAELGTFDIDVQTGETVTNLRHEQIFGYETPQTNWGPAKLLEHVHADDRERVREAIRKTARLGAVRFEFRVVRRDGEVRWVAASGNGVYDESGRMVRVVGTVKDITERKLGEEKLRESATRLEMALEAGQLGIYEADVVQRTITGNRRYGEILGLSEAPVGWESSKLRERVHPEDREALRRAIAGSDATGTIDIEGRTVWPDGSVHWAVLRSQAVRDASGRVVKRIGTVQDITERKQGEIAIADSERRFREFFRQIRDAVVFHRVSEEGMPGRFLEANEAACLLLGYSREEMLERSPLDIDAPESEVDGRTEMKRLLAGEAIVFEQTHVAKDGRRIPVEINSHLFNYKGTASVISVIRDIRERKRAEQALRESHTRLEMALEAGRLGIYETDLDAGVVTSNLQHGQMFGFTEAPQGWKRERFYERCHAEDRERVARDLEEGDRRGHSESEFRVVWPDGSVHWILARSRTLYDTNGKAIKRVGAAAELTEQKAAEEAIRKSAELYRSILAATAEGIVAQDAEGRITAFSAQAERILGRSKDELMGATSDDAMWGAVKEDGTAFAGEEHPAMVALRTEQAQSGVVMGIRWKNGERRWILVTAQPMRNEATGKLEGVVSTFLDVTMERVIDKELAKYRQLLEVFIAYAPAAIAMFDRNLRYIRTSRKWRKETGVPEGEPLAGRLNYEVFPELPEIWTEAHRRGLAGETVTGEDGWTTPEGRQVQRRWEVHPWGEVAAAGNGAAADSGGIMVMFEDITEQRKAEQELQHGRQQLEAFISQAPVAIAMFDREMRYIRASQKYCTELQIPADGSVVGRSHYEVVANQPEEALKACRRALQGETVTGEVDWPSQEGTSHRLRWEMHPWGEAPGKNGEAEADSGGIMLVFEDVTERRKLEAQLRQALKMEAVGQLAGGVAHDFNNLLQVILGYSEMLQEQFKQDEGALHKTTAILEATKRATGLTRQLLAFSRKQVLHTVVLDLNKVLESTTKLLKRLLPEHIEVVVQAEEGLWHTEADADQLAHALINLAINSRDAMPRGGRLTIATRSARLKRKTPGVPEALKPGEYVLLTVEDTGTGIDAEGMRHLFEPFYTTKAKGKGTGLGLASVYGIVKQSAGFVWAESTVGEGTRFTVALPRTEKHEAAQFHPEHAESAETLATVLVVDDDAVVRATVAEHVQSLGYTVLTATPEEALKMALRHRDGIQLLITDVVMPGTSGPELAAQVKAVNPRIKTLFISGYVDSAFDRPDILRSQAVLLHKPFTLAELGLKIKEALQW